MLERTVGNVFIGGGCVWQRQDHDSPKRVRRGMASWYFLRNKLPITLAVVSRMDSVTLYEGADSKGRSERRVDYLPLAEDLKQYVPEYGIVRLCLQQHSATCAVTIDLINAIATGRLAEVPLDSAACPEDTSLLQCDDAGRAPFVPTDESRGCTVDVRGSHCATRTETVPSGRIFFGGE